MPAEPTLTTGQIATHCRVNYRTVIRWIKQGRMEAHQLPGRGDHRVAVSDFVRFLQENQLPVPIELLESDGRVLIVDDEPEMARAIQRVLRRSGFKTEIALNGFQAGSLLETYRPSVITLDLQMPGLGGLAVLDLCRQPDRKHRPRVLIVSGSTRATLDEALDHGADDVLAKPFDDAELSDKIQRLAGRIA